MKEYNQVYRTIIVGIACLSTISIFGCGPGGGNDGNIPTLNIQSGNITMLDQKGSYNKQSCEAGIEKAKELKLNPVCVFSDQKRELALTPGSMVSIKNNDLYFASGDMVINVGDSPVLVQGVNLNPNEMAAWQGNIFSKMTK